MEYTYQDIDCKWDPEDHTIAKTILGSKDFFNYIVENHVDQDHLNDDVLAASEFVISKNVDPDRIFQYVSGLEHDQQLKEKLLIYYLRENTNMNLQSIGMLVEKRPKAVSKSYQRTKEVLLRSEQLNHLRTMKIW